MSAGDERACVALAISPVAEFLPKSVGGSAEVDRRVSGSCKHRLRQYHCYGLAPHPFLAVSHLYDQTQTLISGTTGAQLHHNVPGPLVRTHMLYPPAVCP